MKVKTDVRDIRKEAIEDAQYVMIVAMASVLSDKLHFGKRKLLQTMNQFLERFDLLNGNYVTIDELRQILLDEYDVDIRRHERR